MRSTPVPCELRENPPLEERREIDRRRRLVRLDWPNLAARLAEELSELAARMADDPQATEADRERVERALAVVGEYRLVRDDDE